MEYLHIPLPYHVLMFGISFWLDQYKHKLDCRITRAHLLNAPPASSAHLLRKGMVLLLRLGSTGAPTSAVLSSFFSEGVLTEAFEHCTCDQVNFFA